jgi:hypothetical protein
MPVCPIHNVEMKPSKFAGGFYCTSKMPDGAYCTQKVTAPATPAKPAMPPSQTSEMTLRMAALEFAGRVHAGTGVGADPGLAIQTAEIAVAWLRRP